MVYLEANETDAYRGTANGSTQSGAVHVAGQKDMINFTEWDAKYEAAKIKADLINEEHNRFWWRFSSADENDGPVSRLPGPLTDH